MLRVPVKPELLRWTRKRSGYNLEEMSRRFEKLPLWENEEAKPTLKQLEKFAKATYVPIGYLLLDKPPAERIPIPDLRAADHRKINRPSPNLLDTIYICQQRQAWYRDFARMSGHEPLALVASASMHDAVEKTAYQMRKTLGFDLEQRRNTWTDALRQFIQQADHAGIMVMASGVVGNNSRRKLKVEEFRGFALSDNFAPLVFINSGDTKAAQTFTLAHELAHIWLGENALSDASLTSQPPKTIEAWCNKVAAEFLVPRDELKHDLEAKDPEAPLLARKYKVSTLVILRRLFDIGYLDKKAFNKNYEAELVRLKEIIREGGHFYHTAEVRVSRRFARDLTASAYAGQTSFTEAFRLLGIKKMATFKEISRRLGVIVS